MCSMNGLTQLINKLKLRIDRRSSFEHPCTPGQVGGGLMQRWELKWGGGMPLIELKNSKISISCFMRAIDPIPNIFKNLLDQAQGIVGTHFPKLSIHEILRFPKIICLKGIWICWSNSTGPNVKNMGS